MTLSSASFRSQAARCLVSVALIGVAGVAAAQQAGTPVRGGRVAVAIGSDPTSVNPNLSTNYQNQLVGCMIYQGLVQVKRDGAIMPLLAKSWTISPDGLTYSFDLVKASWHDGKPFTSEDVVYTLTNISAKLGPIFNAAGQRIESVTAPAGDKVVVKLKEPFGPFLMSLACPQNGAIMPAHVYKGTDPLTNPASQDKPVGTGPFKLVEWNRGNFVRLEKNANYWEAGKPYLDQVTAKIIPTASSRLQSLRAGEIDFIGGANLPPSDYAVIKGTKGLKLENSGFAPGAKSLFLNTAHKPLDDKRVRQALMLATDRNFLYRAVWFGTGGLGVQPFTTKLPLAAHPTVDYRKMYPLDIKRANGLLDAAGFKRDASGKRFSVAFVYRAEDADVAQVSDALKSMWRAIGVEVRGEVTEGTSYVDRIYTKGNFDMTMVGYTSYGDPALGIGRTFVTTSIGKPFGNASRYSNPEVDKLFDQGAKTTAQAERAVFYRKAAEILADDLPTLTFHEYQHDDGATERLKGLWGGQGYGWWNEAWVSR
jgi:peptide/nickel transport system substrate-binding protein